MVQQLGASTVLREDPSSLPSTHLGRSQPPINHCNFCSRRSNTSGLHRHLHTHSHFILTLIGFRHNSFLNKIPTASEMTRSGFQKPDLSHLSDKATWSMCLELQQSSPRANKFFLTFLNSWGCASAALWCQSEGSLRFIYYGLKRAQQGYKAQRPIG